MTHPNIVLAGIASGSYDLPGANLKDKRKDMGRTWIPAAGFRTVF